MTPPKTIYLQVCGTCQDNECDKCDFNDLSEVTWCKDRINDNDVAYFSEEHVRQILRKVVDDANHLIDISTTLHKTKLDSEKYIPHVIDLLMKGGENGKETD